MVHSWGWSRWSTGAGFVRALLGVGAHRFSENDVYVLKRRILFNQFVLYSSTTTTFMKQMTYRKLDFFVIMHHSGRHYASPFYHYGLPHSLAPPAAATRRLPHPWTTSVNCRHWRNNPLRCSNRAAAVRVRTQHLAIKRWALSHAVLYTMLLYRSPWLSHSL